MVDFEYVCVYIYIYILKPLIAISNCDCVDYIRYAV